MNKKVFRNYYIFSAAAVLPASIYPLYTGVRIVSDMSAVIDTSMPKGRGFSLAAIY